MKTNPSLIQRFFSDTPDLFKVIQLIGLLMVLANHVLNHYHITGAFTDELLTIGLVISFLSQFVMKDAAVIEGAASPLAGVVQLIPDLINQFDGLKTALADHATTNAGLLQSITTLLTGTGVTAPSVQLPGPDTVPAEDNVINTGPVKLEVKS